MRSDTPPSSPLARARVSGGWFLAACLALALIGVAYEPGWAQDEDETQPQTRVLSAPAGGTADSNGSMIAVTGVDVTGQSILYLVDTETKQLCAYQASGGSSSTQGIKFVGARRIELDLMLDGFNDKTESNGRPLSYKDLARMFESRGLTPDSPEDEER